jgi:hypothetical protein
MREMVLCVIVPRNGFYFWEFVSKSMAEQLPRASGAEPPLPQ